MPIWHSRYNHAKVYRPNGMKYASGRSLFSPGDAISNAQAAFLGEFGRLPEQEKVVFEVIGATAVYDATVFEVEA